MTLSGNEEVGKLFVGGLSWDSSKEKVHQYFSQFGEVVDCVVMMNNETGRSRGFGFVTYKDPSSVSIVLANGPHQLDGRRIDPKCCTPRSVQKAKKANSLPKIFLGGLPTNVTETDLREFFGKYGKVMEVVIMYDQERNKSRGFGFLAFENEESVNQVCAEHYVTISNKQVECKRAEPRDLSKTRAKGNFAYTQWGTQPMAGAQGDWGQVAQGGMPTSPNGPGGQPPANGVMSGTAYQPGWGPPPQNPYTPPAAGYAGGYWGVPPPAGYTPYSAPAPQYSQQGYPGYGPPMGYGYGGYAAAPAAPAPPPPATAAATTSQPSPQSPYGQGAVATSSAGATAADPQGYAMASISSGYGQNEGYNSGTASQPTRSSSQSTGYHPYRRV